MCEEAKKIIKLSNDDLTLTHGNTVTHGENFLILANFGYLFGDTIYYEIKVDTYNGIHVFTLFHFYFLCYFMKVMRNCEKS